MEPLGLTWDDVLWDQGKMRVHSTKTARHEGKDIRYVPLRDIRECLEAVFELAQPGEKMIITRFSGTNSNLDKPMKVILHHAGLVPWPKLFQNMRASCETEWLNEGHPAHVVAAAIGHSVKVQRQSYAQITEGHFEAFNSLEVGQDKNRSLCASDTVGSDGMTWEMSERVVSGSAGKTLKAPENVGLSGHFITGGGTRTHTGN